MRNRLIWTARILVGLLFIFSGLVKINDPLGFSYKLQEYFEVFHLAALDGLALSLAIILCTLEIVLGFGLLIGVARGKIAWGLLLLIIFFAFLTFYSAYFKVVQTCGCFGDAIPLTPWQSFSKDLVLLVLVAFLFRERRHIQPLLPARAGVNALAAALGVSLALGWYTYSFLPLIDFLPYRVGANIPAEMQTPPGAAPDVYEVTYRLKNRKTGELREMSDREYLRSNIWKDNNWIVSGDPESRLVQKGYTPPVRDLAIQDAQGNNYTNELLSNPFYNLIIVAYDLRHTNVNALGRLNALSINLAQNFNTRSVLLTSSSPADANAFAKAQHLAMEVFFADEVPLKSMVRANPGVLLMKGGTIVAKWHYHSVPTYEELAKHYLERR